MASCYPPLYCVPDGARSAGGSSRCSSLASSPSPSASPSASPSGLRVGAGPQALFSFALPARQAKLTYKEQQHAIHRALEAAPSMAAGATLATLEKGGE